MVFRDAATSGMPDVARLLLERGLVTDVNATLDWLRRTALHLAATWGHVDVVEVLLAHRDVDVNVRALDAGKTPLHIAAQNGHVDVVRALLAHRGVNVNAWSVGKVTPLCLANVYKRIDVAKCLLEHGAEG